MHARRIQVLSRIQIRTPLYLQLLLQATGPLGLKATGPLGLHVPQVQPVCAAVCGNTRAAH